MKKLRLVALFLPIMLASCSSLVQLNERYDDELYAPSPGKKPELVADSTSVAKPSQMPPSQEKASETTDTVSSPDVYSYRDDALDGYLYFDEYPDYYYTRRLNGWYYPYDNYYGGYNYESIGYPYYRGAVVGAGAFTFYSGGWYYGNFHSCHYAPFYHPCYHHSLHRASHPVHLRWYDYSKAAPHRKEMPRTSLENRNPRLHNQKSTTNTNKNYHQGGGPVKTDAPRQRNANTIFNAPARVFKREGETRENRRYNPVIQENKAQQPAVERRVFRPFSKSSDDYKRQNNNQRNIFRSREPIMTNDNPPQEQTSPVQNTPSAPEFNKPNSQGGTKRMPRR